jgi:hypothetical protein
VSQARTRRYVVVGGAGVAGALHVAAARALGIDAVVIDPGGAPDAATGYPDLRLAATAGILDSPCTFAVATPTARHVEDIAAVLDVVPTARLVLEKPVWHPECHAAASRLLAEYSGARVLVNDLYAVAPPIHEFRAVLRQQTIVDRNRLVLLTVDFAKRRAARGRHVDHRLGALGYEWHHMLSIVRALLPDGAWSQFCDRVGSRWQLQATPTSNGWDDIALVVEMPEDWPTVGLYTSMRGLVRLERTTADSHDDRHPGWRHRTVRADFADGGFAELHLEPTGTIGPRSRHRLVTHLGARYADRTLVCDIFRNAVARAVWTFDNGAHGGPLEISSALEISATISATDEQLRTASEPPHVKIGTG